MEYIVYVMPTTRPSLTVDLVEKETGKSVRFFEHKLAYQSGKDALKEIMADIDKELQSDGSTAIYKLEETTIWKQIREREAIKEHWGFMEFIELYGGKLEEGQKRMFEGYKRQYQPKIVDQKQKISIFHKDTGELEEVKSVDDIVDKFK